MTYFEIEHLVIVRDDCSYVCAEMVTKAALIYLHSTTTPSSHYRYFSHYNGTDQREFPNTG